MKPTQTTYYVCIANKGNKVTLKNIKNKGNKVTHPNIYQNIATQEAKCIKRNHSMWQASMQASKNKIICKTHACIASNQHIT
jgi:hypothetical protein